MPDPKNQLNETISHLAERVSGIAVTLHLFEERMKSLTSSLGRVSALLLLQAGIPIGGVGSLFNAARFLGGTTKPNPNNPYGNQTAFRLSQIEQGMGSPGGKGGSGVNLDFLSEVGLAALTGSAKKEVQETSGLLTEMMQIFKKQIRDLISSEMGPRGGSTFKPADPRIVADTQAAWKASGPKPVFVDMEWAVGPNGEKNFLQAGFAKSGEVGQHFNLPPDPNIPINAKSKEDYYNTVSISQTDLDNQLAGVGTAHPRDYFKALAEKLKPGHGLDTDNPTVMKKFFQDQKLWVFRGAGDAEGLDQIWKGAYPNAGADSLSPFSFGDKDSNVMEVSNLPGVQKRMRQLAKQGKSASLQDVFYSLYGKDADKVLNEQEKAHGSLGHRNDSKDPGQRRHHISSLDSVVTDLAVSKAQSEYEKDQAKRQNKEGNYAILEEVNQGRKLTPKEASRLKTLENQAAVEFSTVMQVLPDGTEHSQVIPIPPEIRAARQKELEEYKQQLARTPDKTKQKRASIPLGLIGGVDSSHLTNAALLDSMLGPDQDTAIPLIASDLVDDMGPVYDNTAKHTKRRNKRLLENALGVDHPLAGAGAKLKKGGFKGVVDERSWGGTWKDLKNNIGLGGESGGVMGAASAALGPLRAFAIALAQATGMLGALAKAGAPDAFETLKGVLHVIAAQLGSMLVPAIVTVTQKFISLAEGIEKFRHSRLGSAAGSTVEGYAQSYGNGWIGLARGAGTLMGVDMDSRERESKRKWTNAVSLVTRPLGSFGDAIRDNMPYTNPRSSGIGAGSSAFGNELRKAISLVSVKTTPQYSSLEDTYKKVQLDVLGKGPIEKILERIQEESLLKMLEKLESMDSKMSGSPTRPFGSI